MKLAQLYYTSCRRGINSGPGFQTRSMSVELSMEERREIEAKGGYRLPRDLDFTSLSAPVDETLPVAYRSYRLQSGRFVLTRSASAGLDYSGRGGNFYAHSIVFMSEPPAGVWPCSFLNWSGWLPQLAPEQDNLDVPPPLPVIELLDITSLRGPEAMELSSFLQEQDQEGKYFPAMLAALFLSLRDGRILLIRDIPRKNVQWLACLQFALPPSLAWRLNWSSYQDDPRGAGQINATCGETNYRLDRNARDFQYYLFDFSAGQFSTVELGEQFYARQIAAWMLEEPGKLTEFQRFSGSFSRELVPEQLPEVLMLFHMASGEGDWHADEWNRAAELIRKSLDTNARRGLLEQFESAAGKIDDNTIVPWFSFYVELSGGNDISIKILDEAFLERLLTQAGPAQLGQMMASLAAGKTISILAIAEKLQSACYQTRPAATAGSLLRQFAATFLAQMSFSPESLEVRKKLESSGCYDMLLGEWDARLANAGSQVNIWCNYRDSVLKHLPAYEREYTGLLAESAWRAMSSASKRKMAQEWCGYEELALLSADVRKEIISTAYKSLAFDFSPGSNQTEQSIIHAAKKWDVSLIQDRQHLRALMRMPEVGLDKHEVQRYASSLFGLPAREYQAFLDGYFPALLNGWPRHRPELLLACMMGVLDMTRESEWCKALEKCIGKLAGQLDEDKFRTWLLDFWLGQLAKNLSSQARLRLLPVMTRLYLDFAGERLLQDARAGIYLDELRLKCERERPKPDVSLVDRLKTGFLNILPFVRRAREDLVQPESILVQRTGGQPSDEQETSREDGQSITKERKD